MRGLNLMQFLYFIVVILTCFPVLTFAKETHSFSEEFPNTYAPYRNWFYTPDDTKPGVDALGQHWRFRKKNKMYEYTGVKPRLDCEKILFPTGDNPNSRCLVPERVYGLHENPKNWVFHSSNPDTQAIWTYDAKADVFEFSGPWERGTMDHPLSCLKIRPSRDGKKNSVCVTKSFVAFSRYRPSGWVADPSQKQGNFVYDSNRHMYAYSGEWSPYLRCSEIIPPQQNGGSFSACLTYQYFSTSPPSNWVYQAPVASVEYSLPLDNGWVIKDAQLIEQFNLDSYVDLPIGYVGPWESSPKWCDFIIPPHPGSPNSICIFSGRDFSFDDR